MKILEEEIICNRQKDLGELGINVKNKVVTGLDSSESSERKRTERWSGGRKIPGVVCFNLMNYNGVKGKNESVNSLIKTHHTTPGVVLSYHSSYPTY